jgi:hypothetical protein
MKRALFALPFMLLPALATAAPAPKAAAPAAPAQVLGPPSHAITNEILDAVAEEMNRDLTDLVIPGLPVKIYHISYKLTEVEVNDVSATLGETTSRRPRHLVTLEARVRIGSPQFDNGNFAVPQAEELDGVSTMPLPLEATPRIARRAAWLATDSAFKEALVQLKAKLEAKAAGGLRPTDALAWAPIDKATVDEDPVLVAPLESLDELETRAKALSASMRDAKGIRASHVGLTSYLERRWYLTTDHISVTDTRRASGVVIAATGQDADGQLLDNYFLRYGHTAKDLPSDDELKAEAKKLDDQVAALAKAPVMEPYSGPVLFEGEGAVGYVRSTLALNLGGTPVPDGLSAQDAARLGGDYVDKLGLHVLGTQLSVIDDPTASTGAGKALIGGYKIDDEGVPGQRVEVIKDGTLKALLTARTPAHKGDVSNGHARRQAEGGAYRGSATNLFLTAHGSVSRKALESRAIDAARNARQKYAIIIRRFDDAAITGAPEFTRREMMSMLKTTNLDLPPAALLTYRLYLNGKEELVRGAQLAKQDPVVWKDVLGTSSELTTYNFLASDQAQLVLKLQGGTEEGFVPSGGIESAIVTPDLLFKELDVKAAIADRAIPVVPQPGK